LVSSEPDKNDSGSDREDGRTYHFPDVSRSKANKGVGGLYSREHPPDHEQTGAMAEDRDDDHSSKKSCGAVGGIPGCGGGRGRDEGDREAHAHKRIDPGDDCGQPKARGDRSFFDQMIILPICQQARTPFLS